jgi:hypothetical protein
MPGSQIDYAKAFASLVNLALIPQVLIYLETSKTYLKT